MYWLNFLSIISLLPIGNFVTTNNHQLIFSINAAGSEHTDSNGIYYSKDSHFYELTDGRSDYGSHYIHGVKLQDRILYRTEKWGPKFSYNIPIEDDGQYLLVLKFCEVHFTTTNSRVFDVMLNGKHLILKNFDIIAEVGSSTAHEKRIHFSIIDEGSKLIFGNEESRIIDSNIGIQFLRGHADYPKIAALYVLRLNSNSADDFLETSTKSDFISQHIDNIANYASESGIIKPFTIRIVTLDMDDILYEFDCLSTHPLIIYDFHSSLSALAMESRRRKPNILNNFFTFVFIPDNKKLLQSSMNYLHFIQETFNARKDVVVFISSKQITPNLGMSKLKHAVWVNSLTAELFLEPQTNNFLKINGIEEFQLNKRKMGENLPKRSLTVIGSNAVPYTKEPKSKPSEGSKYIKEVEGSGIHYRLFYETSKAFNFTFKVHHNYQATNNFDIILFLPVPLSSNDDRRDRGPVTWPSTVLFVVGNPTTKLLWYAVVLPFTQEVWVGCLMIQAVMSISLGLVTYLKTSRRMTNEVWKAVGILPFSLLMNQGFNRIPKAIRSFCIIFLVGWMILLTGFSSMLRRHLMFPKPLAVPRTFDDLAAMKEFKIKICGGDAEFNFFRYSENTQLRSISSRFTTGRFIDCVTECLKNVIIDNKVACISWDDIIIPLAAQTLFHNARIQPLTFSTDVGPRSLNSFGFAENSIFTDSFHYILMNSIEMGLIKKYWDSEMTALERFGREELLTSKLNIPLLHNLLKAGSDTNDKEPLTIRNLGFVLCIIPSGLIFSIVSFVYELYTPNFFCNFINFVDHLVKLVIQAPTRVVRAIYNLDNICFILNALPKRRCSYGK